MPEENCPPMWRPLLCWVKILRRTDPCSDLAAHLKCLQCGGGGGNNQGGCWRWVELWNGNQLRLGGQLEARIDGSLVWQHWTLETRQAACLLFLRTTAPGHWLDTWEGVARWHRVTRGSGAAQHLLTARLSLHYVTPVSHFQQELRTN